MAQQAECKNLIELSSHPMRCDYTQYCERIHTEDYNELTINILEMIANASRTDLPWRKVPFDSWQLYNSLDETT